MAKLLQDRLGRFTWWRLLLLGPLPSSRDECMPPEHHRDAYNKRAKESQDRRSRKQTCVELNSLLRSAIRCHVSTSIFGFSVTNPTLNRPAPPVKGRHVCCRRAGQRRARRAGRANSPQAGEISERGQLCRCEFVHPMVAWKISWSLESFAPPGTNTRRHTGGSMSSRRMRSWKTPEHYAGAQMPSEPLEDHRRTLARGSDLGFLVGPNLIATVGPIRVDILKRYSRKFQPTITGRSGLDRSQPDDVCEIDLLNRYPCPLQVFA